MLESMRNGDFGKLTCDRITDDNINVDWETRVTTQYGVEAPSKFADVECSPARHFGAFIA